MPNPISGWTRLAMADLVAASDLIPVIDVSAGAAGSKVMTPQDYMRSAPGTTHCIVGYNAAVSITTAVYVHAFGFHALYAATTALQATAFGRQAGAAITTADSCTCVGAIAGLHITTGTGNTAIGANTLQNTTTGPYNVAVGNQALYTGAAAMTVCVGVGADALYSNTGDGNTGIGARALYSKAAGANNVAIGENAGRYSADGSTALTAATGCIYIGRGARGSSATGDNNTIVIGYSAIGLGANTVQIGTDATTILTQLAGVLSLTGTNTTIPGATANKISLYCADAGGAGTGCLFTKTEAGDVLKLYKGAAVADATDAASVILRLNELLAHLRLMGIIAT